MRWLRSQLIFYGNFSRASLGVTGMCLFALWQAANPYFIIPMFWLKVVTWFLILAYQVNFGNSYIHFYRNLRFSAIQLYGFSIAFDFLIWLIGSLIIL